MRCAAAWGKPETTVVVQQEASTSAAIQRGFDSASWHPKTRHGYYQDHVTTVSSAFRLEMDSAIGRR